MEQGGLRSAQRPPHPAKSAISDLFNLYLGRNARQRDDPARETSNKMQKRVTAFNRELPPPDEQFILDFNQLLAQFPDQQDQIQIHSLTESHLISLILQSANHAPQSEFLLFSAKSLCSISYLKWDSFIPSLLSSVSSLENQNNASSSVGPSTPATSAFQIGTPASPLSSTIQIGSPTQSSTIDNPAIPNILSSPIKPPPPDPVTSTVDQSTVGSLHQLCCKIILSALETTLKPLTHSIIFQTMINWLINSHPHSPFHSQLETPVHLSLDIIWTLVSPLCNRVPFYELLRSPLQQISNIPNDEGVFSLIMEIHRRRDLVAMHMQMLDQHLHCPSFATHRFLSQSYPSMPGESVGLKYSPITYPSVLGEPLHGEELANSIRKGSPDWERAMRCLRHALRATPSPDWWRRVLLVAPCYRLQAQQQPATPGAVFSLDMIGEAVADRCVELLRVTNGETQCWQDWLLFADIYFFLMKSGGIDFLDFVDKLTTRVSKTDQQTLKTNHITWLVAQILRIEIIMNTLSADRRKVDTIRKIISFHKEDNKPLDSSSSPTSPQGILLDFISSSQTLRIWSFNASIREHLNSDQLQKGKQIDEWWKQMTKGERLIDFSNLDERSTGMFWVLSFTMAQPACEAVMGWFGSAGESELLPAAHANDRIAVMRENFPLSMQLLSGLSINMCLKLAYQLEETIFLGQSVPSIAMVETYVRLLLIAPHSLFRHHFTTLTQRSPSILSKSGISLLLFEILNYRLLPLYRYHGKSKALMYDVTKIIAMIKGKKGEHRLLRLGENLCMNLILSLRDFFLVKKELKGPTEFTETLNRITIVSLAITIKTRGIAEVEHMLYLQPLLEQIMATSQHTWSEKTLRYFPSLIRDNLMGRVDKRGQAIQAWQQAEPTVIKQCSQLLLPSADPTYVMTYQNNSFPQHRQYLCAGSWILMNRHPDGINSQSLGRVLRDFSPEEVTSNIYTMVDVLLHQIQIDQQHGLPAQDLLAKAIVNLVFFIWTHELLPLDILLLALIDRDDDPYALRIVRNLLERPELQQRIKIFCSSRTPEHWTNNLPPKRAELQKALGSHLSWKDRNPPFFDDIAARLLPVIPLVIYRMIENDLMDLAERVLHIFSMFLAFHPLRFTFVRDILAYFYGHLPTKIILRILKILGYSKVFKIPFSETFAHLMTSPSNSSSPPQDYFANLLLSLVINVIPHLPAKSHSDFPKAPPPAQHATDQKAFYQNQDPGSHTQLILETAAIEILSLPFTPAQIVSSFIQIITNIQSSLLQSTNTNPNNPSTLPTSPSSDPQTLPNTSSTNYTNFVSKSGYSSQQLACLMIQACGLLLAQLPQEFHLQLYSEAARVIKECWWLSDSNQPMRDLDSAVGYALMDPTWASQDNTSTAVGNVIALLHAFYSNLPQDWLESSHTVVKHLRPVTSVAMLRIAFRILGPLLPRLAFARPLFMKTLALLFNVLAEVFGKNSQPSTPTDASEISDIIDFLHHAVMYEGQGGPVQSNTKPKLESLTLCSKVLDLLRPDVMHLLNHLRPDPNSSVYAANHPKIVQNPVI
ncbi:hypothetical protein LUZ60_000210 [Juncus effusus]|nr:hypothetical protein LUZ60_000210 [Juncus effusus]